MNNFSEQPITPIYRARMRKRISQRRLAKMIGIDREALRLWEKKGKEPKLRPSQVHRLLSVLDCELVEIVEIEEAIA